MRACVGGWLRVDGRSCSGCAPARMCAAEFKAVANADRAPLCAGMHEKLGHRCQESCGSLTGVRVLLLLA